MKTASLILSLFATVLLLVTIACESNTTGYQIEDTAVMSDGDLNNIQLSKDITAEQTEALVFLREEEKLARDIYTSLCNVHALRVFDNISKSEQQHMNAVKTLLKFYEIQDPVSEDIIGKFQNTVLQNLFDELLLKGTISKTEALSVGAVIEEIDILDIIKSTENLDLNSDILIVFNNLKKGSENHLRAFVKNLKTNGILYKPEYLDNDYFYSVINN